jgi:hypothetical protein
MEIPCLWMKLFSENPPGASEAPPALRKQRPILADSTTEKAGRCGAPNGP